MRTTVACGAISLVFLLLSQTALANGAYSRVDVGRHHADAQAGYDAPAGFARTESRVGNVSLGRGLAIGYGPNGISISHSIGVAGRHLGTAHNFQLSVGPSGTHRGRSGVVTRGGNTRVIVGGDTAVGPVRPYGGSFATGYGRHIQARSSSEVRTRRAAAHRHARSRR
jgi:hypothetical protein